MIRRQAVTGLAALLVAAWGLPASAVTLGDLHDEIDAGHYDAAARQASAYLDTHPGNRDARFLRARALAGENTTQAAIDAFESLAEDYPLRPEPANNLAVLYAGRGDYAKARDWLEKALATQPAYATAHRNLGDVYTALADLAYRKALGSQDVASKTPLTMLDRFYYARESVRPSGAGDPPPKTPPSPHTRERSTVAKPGARAPPAPPADDSRSILQTVRAWALAWSNQDYKTYTDFYSPDFDPGDDLSRAQWLSVRKARLARPDNIHIHIASPRIKRLGPDRARVDFVQRYDSPRYSDEVDKRLVLGRTDAGWRILRETTLPQS